MRFLRRIFNRNPAPFSEQSMLKRILDSEGGISDDSVDRGGLTNAGVTKVALADFRGVKPDQITNADIMGLTGADVREIILLLYYRRPGVHRLPVALRGAVCDFAVNSGPRTAIRFLQQVVGAESDGFIGPETVKCCEGYDSAWVLDKYCNARVAYLERIVKNDPSQERFRRGWIARAERWRRG